MNKNPLIGKVITCLQIADDRASLAEALRKLIAHTDALCEDIRQDPAGYDNWRRHHDLLVHYGALDGARDVLAKHGPAGPMLPA